jgi:hypothetical protein
MGEEIKYALKHKESGRFLGFEATCGSETEFYVGTSYYLSHLVDNDWYADLPEQAEYVRRHSTKLYNTDYDSLNHNYNPDELEVVKLTITTTEEVVEVELPSFEDVTTLKSGGNEKYYEFLMKRKSKDPRLHYGLYETSRLIVN